MKREPTIFSKLKPGDLFFYPPDRRADSAGVNVRLDDSDPEDDHNANVVRIVCECEAETHA